jgi:hypothetical protein
MSPLTRKRDRAFRSSGTWKDEDYDLLANQGGRSHLRTGQSRRAAGASMAVVGHRDRAGNPQRDERHRRDPAGGDGEVSRGVA